MRHTVLQSCLALVAVLGAANLASAQADFTAANNGLPNPHNWNNSTTWTTNSVPTSANSVAIGALSAGAAQTVTVNVTTNQAAASLVLGDGNATAGTLTLDSATLAIGGAFTVGGTGNGIGIVTHGTGSFTAQSLVVKNAGSTLTFANSDAVSQSVALSNGGQLTLATGKALTVSGGTITVTKTNANNTVLNAANNAITAATIILSRDTVGQAVTNPGAIAATTLTTTNVDLNLVSGSNVGTFTLNSGSSVLAAGATVQTLNLGGGTTVTQQGSGTGTAAVAITGGSSLTLATGLNAPTAAVTVTGANSTFNAASNSVRVGSLTVGATGSASQFQNPALVTVANALTVAGTSMVALQTNGDSVGSIVLNDTAQLTANAAPGQTMGVTITNPASTALAINGGATLVVNLDRLSPGYALRWANPTAGGDHINDLQALIDANKITFNVITPGSVPVLESVAGFTQITVPVPEPALILAVGLLPLAYRRFRRASGGR